MLIKININEVDIAKVKDGTFDGGIARLGQRNDLPCGTCARSRPSALSNETAGQSGGGGRGQWESFGFRSRFGVDKTDKRLKPGMSARCAIIVARRTERAAPADQLHPYGGR